MRAALNFTMGAFGLASILAPVAYAALVRAFPARRINRLPPRRPRLPRARRRSALFPRPTAG